MTEQEFHQLTYNFRIKRPLPLYDLPKPPTHLSYTILPNGDPIIPNSEKECCVIFPIFKAYEQQKTPPTYIINSAFWAAHSWRVNTDCIEKGWDIFFLLDRELWKYQSVRDQFEKANLTQSIIFFDMLPGRAIRHKLGAKFYAITAPDFRWYYRAYIWDTDNFVSTRDPQDILKTERLLDMGQDEALVNTLFWNTGHERGRPVWREKYEKDTEEFSRPIYDAFLEKYLGYPPTTAWGVSGQLYVWNPRMIRQSFKDMVLELTPNIADDEDQYGAYLEKTGIRPMPLQDIWKIPMYFKREDYFREDSHYFDHVWLQRGDEDDKEWFGHSSQREFSGISAYNAPDIREIWVEGIGLNRRI